MRQLTNTYLIAVLSYGCEIVLNCHSDNKNKLNLAYSDIEGYAFLKALRKHISHLSE